MALARDTIEPHHGRLSNQIGHGIDDLASRGDLVIHRSKSCHVLAELATVSSYYRTHG